MKKYILAFIGGKYYRLEIDEKLNKALKFNLKDDYKFKDNILVLNTDDATYTYNLKVKAIKAFISLIVTYNLAKETKEKVDLIQHGLMFKKQAYSEDLKKIEITLYEVMQIYKSLKDKEEEEEEESSQDDSIYSVDDIKNLLKQAESDSYLKDYINDERIENFLDNLVVCQTDEEYKNLTNNVEFSKDSFKEAKVIVPRGLKKSEFISGVLSSQVFKQKIEWKPKIYDIALTERNMDVYAGDIVSSFAELAEKNNRDREKMLDEYLSGYKNELYYFINDIVKKNGGDEKFKAKLERTLIEEALRKNYIARSFLERINARDKDDTEEVNSSVRSVSISMPQKLEESKKAKEEKLKDKDEEKKAKEEEKKGKEEEKEVKEKEQTIKPKEKIRKVKKEFVPEAIDGSLEKGTRGALRANSRKIGLGVKSGEAVVFRRAQGSNGVLNRNPLVDEEVANDEENVNENNDNLENGEVKQNEELNVNDDINVAGANNLQNRAQNALKMGIKNVSGEAAKKAMTVIFGPKVLIIIGIVVFLVLIFAVVFANEENNSTSSVGLYGYPYLDLGEYACDEVYVYNTPLDQDGVYSLDEYVAGVVNAEIGGFRNEEIFKTFAVAARTYALNWMRSRGKKCEISASTRESQSFSKTDDETILKAVESTKGLVLTRNRDIFATEYDAFAWKEKDDDYYYLKQKELQIPVDWVENHVYTRYLENAASGGHGRGMSQFGSYYLITELGYTWEDVLTYFYGEDIEIMSIYPSTLTGEYPINPNDELYQDYIYLRDKSFEDMLAENGYTPEEYDAYLKSIVEQSGLQTRTASANFAVSFIGSIAEMGYQLNYDWGGKNYYPEVDRNWGLKRDNLVNNCQTIGDADDINFCITNYKWKSFDCSGFVNWVLINSFGREAYNEKNVYSLTRNSTGIHKALDASKAVCKVGDLLAKSGAGGKSGHVVMIVGIDTEQKKYIIAESRGGATGGVRLSYMKFNEKNYDCLDLSSVYEGE